MADSKVVISALMNRLHDAFTTGEDDGGSPRPDRAIAWFTPGIPMQPEDLRFASQGLVGKGADVETKAADTASLIQQMSSFARLVDRVPDATGIIDGSGGLDNGVSLSRVYESVLKQSQVASSPLSEEEKAKLERFRNLMYPEKEEEDLITGEKRMMRVEGPLIVQYKRLQTKYENALFEYNDARIKGNVAATPQNVLNWTLNESVFWRRFQTAQSEWEAAGRRMEIEKMLAFIEHVTMRDMTLWKADLFDRLDKCRMADSIGNEFFFTGLIPGNFADSKDGWTTFTFSEKESEKHSTAKSSAFSAQGKGGWGPLSFSGGGEKSKESRKEVSTVTNFSMTFSVTQGLISRPFCDFNFLRSRAWRLAPGAVDVTELSDGGAPPQGMMPFCPTTVLFARDIVINFDELHDESSEVRKQLAANAGGGYGPFKISGSYKRGSEERTVTQKVTAEGIEVTGMQMIGLGCWVAQQRIPDPEKSIQAFE